MAAKRKTPAPPVKRKVGRPSKYTPELAAEIVERLASESLERICEDPRMPTRQTVYNWQDDPKRAQFLTDCARARKRQAASDEAKVLSVAAKCEAGHLNPKAAAVVISAYQWHAKVIDPAKYGDRTQIAATDAEGNAAGFFFGVIGAKSHE